MSTTNYSLNICLELFGPEQLMLGSDYPFPLGESSPGKLIESMNLSNQTSEQLFHLTAQTWLSTNSKE